MSNNEDWLRQIGVCREINQKINDFGVSDYQRLKIIEFLSLELENREVMLSILDSVKPCIISKEELIAPQGELSSGIFNPGNLE